MAVRILEVSDGLVTNALEHGVRCAYPLDPIAGAEIIDVRYDHRRGVVQFLIKSTSFDVAGEAPFEFVVGLRSIEDMIEDMWERAPKVGDVAFRSVGG
jgi:hypothetical protein